MADDRQEVPAKSPKAPSATQSAIAHRPDSKPASNKWRGWAYKHWHAIMFLIFFVISVAAGFYYRWESDPGAEPTDFKNQAPQYLNVYLSYGQHFLASTVSVEIDLDNSQFSPFTNDFSPNLNVDGFTKFIEYVTVTVKSAHPIPQGTIVITSTSKPSDLNYVEDRSVPGPPEFVLATSLSPDALLNSGGQYGAIAVAAFLPVPIIWEGHGSIYSHLPSVGVIQYSNGNIPNVLAEFERRTGPAGEGPSRFGWLHTALHSPFRLWRNPSGRPHGIILGLGKPFRH